MNIQDISDFIDLVKNPTKYEAVLQNLKEEQGRLNASIETIGKASELDKLRKAVEKQRDALESTYLDKLNKLDEAHASRMTILEGQLTTVAKQQADAKDALNSANEQLKVNAEITKSLSNRESDLRKKEDTIATLQSDLSVRVSEYDEKLAKLRSVMN
jgi:chromosome segregation ATPase